MQRTPKTLMEAIANAGIDPHTMVHIHAHVKDFLSQVFQIEIMSAQNPEEEERLHALFKRIVQRGEFIP